MGVMCVRVGWGWREGPKSTRGCCVSNREREKQRERSLALLIFEWWQFFRVETWPPFNLSILRHENGRKEGGGWGDQSRNLCWVLCQIDFLLCITFILRQTIKLTYLLLTCTQQMAKTEIMCCDLAWTWLLSWVFFFWVFFCHQINSALLFEVSTRQEYLTPSKSILKLHLYQNRVNDSSL